MANQRPVVWKNGRLKEFVSGDNLQAGSAIFAVSALTGTRTFTMPDSSGTVMLLEAAQTVTGAKAFEDATAGPGSGSFIFRATSTGNILLDLRSLAGTIAQNAYRSGTSLRWQAGKDAGSESGGNAGSPYTIVAYDDAGTLIGVALSIARATRVVTFPVAPAFTDAAGTRTNLGATTVGANLFTLANPGAIRFLRVDAANTVTARSAADFATDLGLGTGDTPSFAALVTTSGSPRFTRTGANNLTVALDVDAGQSSTIVWRTGTSNRWLLTKGSAAESGGNAGSPLTLSAYDDASALLGTVFTITRSTQVIAFTQSPTAPTPSAGDNSTKVCTTAYFRTNSAHSSYRTIIDRTGSHTNGRTGAPSTYAVGQGDPCAIASTGTLYPAGAFYYDPADHPTLDGLAPKLRVRAQVWCNDVAPGVTFTFGLHPVTNPATSGAAGVRTYNISAAVAGSTVALATPAADSGANNSVSADFAAPTAGMYVLGFVQSGGNTAASSHCHISMQLQMRNN